MYWLVKSAESDIINTVKDYASLTLIAQILAMAKDKEPGSHRKEYEEKNRRAYEQGEALYRACAETLDAYEKRLAAFEQECAK